MLTDDLFSFIRECAVKFNDYFEFPRDMDMEPFTELGLAKLQGKSFSLESHLSATRK